MQNRTEKPPLELWGGIECTVNRVGDRYFDQLERSGHAHRIEDLTLVAQLGIKTLRYPVLWERVAPNGLDKADWTWADERLGRLRALGIRPIVTLVHHGSGPQSTSLLERSFVDGLAAFAGAVAERYPWIEDYTPVNEPLTTARFSALYGHWYPHARDIHSCITALVYQCSATVNAMRAIRRVNSSARLIQTEDIGKTYSTPLLSYQSGFQNEFRWLSLDLLTGRFQGTHPLWSWMNHIGINHAWLKDLLPEPCPPDVIGLNYYVTSERFLDERLDRYPEHSYGGNGIHSYADVEAVRVFNHPISGFGGIIRETWDRFGTPLAITEVHLGDSVDERIRWLLEAWSDAWRARANGVDVRAVTVWSLLGTFDWNSLVTLDAGQYEPGVFDVSDGSPRATGMEVIVQQLSDGIIPIHPALDQTGWWHRPERICYSLSEEINENSPP